MEQNNKTNYKHKIELNYYESKELEKKAEQLVKEGNYTEAIEYYTILAEAKPHNLNYKNEIKKLEKNIKKIKKEAEDKYHKAIELERQEKYKEAIDSIKKAIKLDPDNTEYQNKLQELKNKNKQKARQHYEKAEELKKQGKYEEAIEYYEKARKLDPKNKEYKKKKEELILTVKNEKISIDYYKQTQDWYAKALKYIRMDKNEDAKNCFEEVIKYYNKAINELHPKNDKNKIIKLYEEIIKILSKDEEKDEEVIDYYNKIIRLNPVYPEYYQKKRDKIKKERKRREEEKKKQAEKLYKQALNYAQIGEYESAIDCCIQAIELQPNNKKYQNEIPKLEIKLDERKKEEERNQKHRKNVQKDAMGI